MRTLSALVLLLLVLPITGCYHAQIDTGRTPGAVVIDKPFASGWVYGLIPPDPVAAAEECPSGVARVETQHSFVNQLVTALTFGIYTPMHITVTCAAAASAQGSQIDVPEGVTSSDVLRVFEAAADDAVASGEAVYVRFASSRR